MTSTATCVAFLVHTGQWDQPGMPWSADGPQLAKAIVTSDWNSAELGDDNEFTTAFLLEALCDLRDVGPLGLSADDEAIVERHFSMLEDELGEEKGIGLRHYPPTSFMTQKATRVIKRHVGAAGANELALRGATTFAWRQLREESMATSVHEPDADVFELGYAAVVVAETTPLHEMTPRQRDALTFAIGQFFDAQRSDGTWPRSQPLFHYPEYGNAYCYDYEFLVQLLSEVQLRPILLSKIDALDRAARALDRLKIPIADDGSVGWASGHLKRETPTPESWSTASAFHYCHAFNRLIGDALRQSLFTHVGARYVPPVEATATGSIDPSRFLDTPVSLEDGESPRSLLKILDHDLLAPLLAAKHLLYQGRPLPDTVPTSAILYGPPGTSKTQLGDLIATALAWPLLKLDPSHLTTEGLASLHAEANRIFVMLEAVEGVVVLLDEFDELVRERDESGSELASRFLTTSMLPKLAALYSRRRIVYLLATNHVERFDAAISREGRFDLILPVMPPTLAAKLQKWSAVATKMTDLGLTPEDTRGATVRAQLEDLTYSEFRRFVSRVAHINDADAFVARVAADHVKCTLLQPTADDPAATWKDRLLKQRAKIRLWEPYSA